jgi:putative SOS response-associated peptidase YedK
MVSWGHSTYRLRVPWQVFMCNLYAMTSNIAAIEAIAGAMTNTCGNLEAQNAIFANGFGPIVRNGPDGPVLAMSRWGMPSPKFVLQGKSYDQGITNVRNPDKTHWKPYLGVSNRCLVPATSFCEPDQASGSKQFNWFALDETRPLFFFAGIWTAQWRSVRKLKDGETVDDLYAFMTTDANTEVKAVHPKAMPVILRTKDEIKTWMSAPLSEALSLQKPLADGLLMIVARGVKHDSFVENI